MTENGIGLLNMDMFQSFTIVFKTFVHKNYICCTSKGIQWNNSSSIPPLVKSLGIQKLTESVHTYSLLRTDVPYGSDLGGIVSHF